MDASRPRIRVGVSSCLLGAAVRYDGGHKRDAWIAGTLSRYFELVPVCPEVAIGLGTPRPPIRLVRTAAGIRVQRVGDPHCDVTGPLRDYARSMAERLAGIGGYIFKQGSPSCGMAGVPVHGDEGTPAGWSAGAYACALMAAMPLLPCEEESRLGDPDARARFIERVLVFDRWRKGAEAGLTLSGGVAFRAASPVPGAPGTREVEEQGR